MSAAPERPRAIRASELARMAGVSTDTLRVYERKGLLPRPSRSPNGYREYPAEACVRIRLVRRALALGFTLDELARIVKVRDAGGAPCREVRALGARKLALLEARLAELTEARERLQAVLRRWDEILGATSHGNRAALLEVLEGIVDDGTPSPLVPPGLRREKP